jgi:hypothetical protein
MSDDEDHHPIIIKTEEDDDDQETNRLKQKEKSKAMRRSSFHSKGSTHSLRSASAEFADENVEINHLREQNLKLKAQVKQMKGTIRGLRDQQNGGTMSANDEKTAEELRTQNEEYEADIEKWKEKAKAVNDVGLLDTLVDELAEKKLQIKALELQRRQLGDYRRENTKLLEGSEDAPSRQKVFLDLKDERRRQLKKVEQAQERKEKLAEQIDLIKKRAETAIAEMEALGLQDYEVATIRNLQKQEEEQQKILDKLQSQIAIANGSFDALKTRTVWQSQDQQAILADLRSELEKIQAQIQQKEAIIMTNSGMTEKPPHFVAPLQVPPKKDPQTSPRPKPKAKPAEKKQEETKKSSEDPKQKQNGGAKSSDEKIPKPPPKPASSKASSPKANGKAAETKPAAKKEEPKKEAEEKKSPKESPKPQPEKKKSTPPKEDSDRGYSSEEDYKEAKKSKSKSKSSSRNSDYEDDYDKEEKKPAPQPKKPESPKPTTESPKASASSSSKATSKAVLPTPGQYYWIVPRHCQEKVLGCAGKGTSNGTKIVLWEKLDKTADQEWTVKHTGDSDSGKFFLHPRHCNLNLDFPAENEPAHLWEAGPEWEPNESQVFEIRAVPGTSEWFNIIQLKGKLFLDVVQFGKTNGTEVQGYRDDSEGDNQMFKFVPVPDRDEVEETYEEDRPASAPKEDAKPGSSGKGGKADSGERLNDLDDDDVHYDDDYVSPQRDEEKKKEEKPADDEIKEEPEPAFLTE